MSVVFKNKDMQDEFDSSGYAKASVLSPEEVEGLLAELAELRPDDGFSPSDPAGVMPTYHVSFLDPNQDYRRKVFELVGSYFALKLQDLLSGYHILNASLIIKPPHLGMFSVHQDWSFLADHAEKCMTVWCPLVDANTVNGTIHLLPGSDKLLEDEIQTPKTNCYFHDFCDRIIECWLQPIPTEAGHALLWDNHMIHWSGDNHANAPRIAVQITCIPIHSQPVYFYYDEHKPERFELIEADQEFWLTTDYQQLFVRQPSWTSLGYVPNRNRLLTEAEFGELLRTKSR